LFFISLSRLPLSICIKWRVKLQIKNKKTVISDRKVQKSPLLFLSYIVTAFVCPPVFGARLMQLFADVRRPLCLLYSNLVLYVCNVMFPVSPAVGRMLV